MILQAESDLTVGQYSDIQDLITGATATYTLQRLNFSWSLDSGTSRGGKQFDVCSTADGFARVWKEGASNLRAEYYSAGTWSTTLDESITVSDPPAIISNGDTVRIFRTWGNNLYYFESTDGGQTWGSVTLIDTITDLSFIAPVSTTVVYAVSNDGTNSRLHRVAYSGSWATTDSNVYIPHAFESFDAETLGDKDVLVFACDGPTRYSTQRQGIWVIEYRDGYYSHIREADVTDEYRAVTSSTGLGVRPASYRESVKLSVINNKLWATYIIAEGGSDNNGHTSYSVSADGQYWQLRQPFKDYTWEAKILLKGDTVYLFGDGETYTSSSTPLTGNSTVNTDITDRVLSYSAQRYAMHQSSITLSNEDEALSYLLTDLSRYQVVEELGYFDSNGDALTQTISLTEVDTVELGYTGPQKTVTLIGRDRMAWMSDQVNAENFETWESQLGFHDAFDNLGHVAVQYGTWSNDSETDELWLTGLSEGLAICTAGAFISNTFLHGAIYVPSSGQSDYAGLLFRSDSSGDNCFVAYYLPDTDTLYLNTRTNGAWDTFVASKSSMGWSDSTWYWIRVEAVGQRIQVFTSPHTVAHQARTWTLAFTYIDTVKGYEEGYVGYIGRSDTDTVKWTDPFVSDGEPLVLVEDAFKSLTAYAGIHSQAFDDYDLDWDTAGASGTWSEVDNVITGTGDGAAQWYWMTTTQTDNPSSFRLTTTKNGDRGAIMFHYRLDGGDTYYSIPRTYNTDAELTLQVKRYLSPDGGGLTIVSMLFDGEVALCTVFYGDVPGVDDESTMLLGVWGSDTVTFTDLRIPELHEELPVISLDVGETPLGALQRAIGRRRIHYRMRFNGSLKANRIKASSNTRTISDSNIDSYTEVHDKKVHASHYRQVGAYEWADQYDTDLLQQIGHRFRKDDNPDLMDYSDCYQEAEQSLNRMAEYAHAARVSFPYSPLQETEDRMSIKSKDWILSGYSITREAGALTCSGEFRKYVY
jgi:hypothetical protein